MRVFKGTVHLNDNQSVANHFVSVKKDSEGRMEFVFNRIIHNLDDHEKFPIPEMEPASFQEQLRSRNRAYAVTKTTDKKYSEFIERMLKEAYPDADQILIEELQ